MWNLGPQSVMTCDGLQSLPQGLVRVCHVLGRSEVT